MKNILNSLFILFFAAFIACSNQNQSTNTERSETPVLVASNDQNLILDSQTTDTKSASDNIIHSQKEAPKPSTETEKPLKKEAKTEAPKKKIDPVDKKTEKEEMQNIKEGKEETSEEIKIEEQAPSQPPLSHDQWDQLLKKYVSPSGKVNYKAFKSENAKLDTYLKYLNDNSIQDTWSKAKKMAYWINAYNAFTIKLIVDNYPVSSITKLHGGKPWDAKWINLGDKTYTLNNIENDILRPKYKDARIHFAVNCAAQSCPPIINKAWTEGNLNQLLEKQAKAFINNSKFNSISANEIEISKIFEWYAVDFGNIIDYLNKYSTTKINKNAKVKYKEYDWALNE